MKITIICVGKIKEKFFQDAIDEYSKRLSRYCQLNIIEVTDEKTPDKAPESIEEQIKEKEGMRILSKIKDDMHVCTLEIAGSRFTSEKMAQWINQSAINGISHIAFVIGGSLGLHKDVIARANMHLSFSDMTFPHQLMRVILCEQIYRSFRIINNEPYHK